MKKIRISFVILFLIIAVLLSVYFLYINKRPVQKGYFVSAEVEALIENGHLY